MVFFEIQPTEKKKVLELFSTPKKSKEGTWDQSIIQGGHTLYSVYSILVLPTLIVWIMPFTRNWPLQRCYSCKLAFLVNFEFQKVNKLTDTILFLVFINKCSNVNLFSPLSNIYCCVQRRKYAHFPLLSSLFYLLYTSISSSTNTYYIIFWCQVPSIWVEYITKVQEGDELYQSVFVIEITTLSDGWVHQRVQRQ